ncbi:MAG: 50S ribosomal protein L4 [Symbiobacteriaceae bacterium]|nr:50S ribosomal protein L4 [Symbiobacteriaceae bacterium]
MPQLPVYNTHGEQVGEIELAASVFEAPISEPSLHQAVVAYLAAQRQGTHSTLRRGEVKGGGHKPWRQKGLGRARAGSSRSPLWRKGGVTFGPKPREYRFKMHRQVRRQAMRSALSVKVRDQEVIILEDLTLEAPKTKEIVRLLDNLKVERKALIVTGTPQQNVYLSARNLPGISVTFAPVINVYDLLLHDQLIMTKEAVAKIEEVFSRA